MIRYGNAREERAHRLLGDGERTPSGEVRLTKIHEIMGEGVEIHGEVIDNEAHRGFAPSFADRPRGPRHQRHVRVPGVSSRSARAPAST